MVYLITTVISLLDQFFKYLVKVNLSINQSIPVIKGFFQLTYIENIGAGFGILKGQRYFFILAALLIVILLFVFRSRRGGGRLLDTAVALIAGGSIGNMIDRIRVGAVVDYLDFRIWPVFNLADSAVVIGTALLIVYIWKIEGRTEPDRR